MTNHNALFVFGSMRDLDVLEVVLGRPLDHSTVRPATLAGYRIGRVPEESYPLLVPDETASAPGDVIDGLSALDWQRIHFFEGDEYDFKRCTVRIDGTQRSEVMFCDNYAHASEAITANWSLSQWQLREKKRFLDVARKFMSFFGHGTQEQADAVWLALETSTRDRSSVA